MHLEILDILACPDCGRDLRVVEASERADAEEVYSGTLACVGCERTFEVVAGVPRFVPSENYARSFGFQWNRFRRTQLDSFSGVPITRNRFFEYSGWPADLTGKRVLDVGCGAGRFAEVALSTGAKVTAIDFSSAVDACQANLGASPRLNVLQADIYRLPFKLHSFDYVYCFGVLQHTPDVSAAFRELPKQLKDGGRIAVDIYPRLLRNVLWPKYWLRPITRRFRPETLFRWIVSLVPLLLPISRAVGRIPLIGGKLKYFVPVVNYDGVYPLSAEQQIDWSILDTFDMLSPAHDHPQTVETLAAWSREAGLVDVEIFRSGFYVARGTFRRA